MKYSYVLFDADETLFRFDILAGMTRMFKAYDIQFTKDDYVHYQKTNKQLWVDYQNGTISADYLQVTRFNEWSEKLNVPAKELNDAFLDSMAKICEPLPGAVELLNKLKPHAKLGIITNGFARLQTVRLEHTGLKNMFEWLVISELVGIAKPNKAIFEHTFELMGNPDKSQILMVGDTASSDVLGGNNVGIDTCWLQHPGEQLPEGITPTYTITTLDQLQSILKI
ncbi:5'-nucleotidase [Pseudoalteromonas carrageenovora]|uniref:DUMP phosphatase n=1 Tax=Pseudoalteromonas carrageenovora IAM 12662 TaxID=1314868 RepID=A0A2K4X6F2_PSEVC|nr:pyrimidine 5'-nucleotidase [Pseudoalteromonas carrageenovora]MBE0382102.1 putative hydrolase of the HAD superfamily [Pseudoalteromonas carrageenovora IAM 12662]QBJ70834.1 5'-nucleotidase [Pseudoalteromonas carrageenovora]GEB69919.1 dUMP phosphatase [Pseudoalteromonas carrageenovora]SOU39900.1 dUMP phosphatase [Pseudoalteromonas carrageenovora IAM 12662]